MNKLQLFELMTNESINPETSPKVLMSNAGYAAAAVCLFLIGFFGFSLNLLVIILMCREKQLWSPLNVILFNLVVSDFAVAILGNPWTLMSAISHRWIFGRKMCTAYGFFMSLLGITSITTLTVLAFERFIIVSRPFNSKGLSRRGALFMLVGIWIYSLILTVPPLFGWGQYVNEAANISCSINWEEQSTNTMSYILFLFAFGLVVPLFVITFSYIHIIKTMKQNRLKMGRVTKAEGKVTWMVLAMIIAFLIAWSPYAILALLIQFGDASLVTPATGVIPALLAKSSICYNPIIYVGLNSQFRQSFMKLFRPKRERYNSTCETYAVGLSKFGPYSAEDVCQDKRNKPNNIKSQFEEFPLQDVSHKEGPNGSNRFGKYVVVVDNINRDNNSTSSEVDI